MSARPIALWAAFDHDYGMSGEPGGGQGNDVSKQASPSSRSLESESSDRGEGTGSEQEPDPGLPSNSSLSDQEGRSPPEADQETGGYDRDAAASEDLRVLVSGLEEVSLLLSGLVVTLMQRQLNQAVDEQPDFVEQVELAGGISSEVSRLSNTVRDLAARGPNQQPDLAFSATTQMTALQSDVKYARKRFSAVSTWTKIWENLKRVVPRLWSLISHLVKVKEWSVTGQVGTGVFGFAQASISVTFG